MILNYFKKYKRFGKYVLVSGITTIVNVASYAVFISFLKDMHIVCNVLSWIISIFITFFLNKKVVFESKSDRKREILKELFLFYMVRLSSLIIDTGVLLLCVKVIGMGDILAKIISNVSTTFNNYFISKYFVFNKKKQVD